MSRKRFVNNAGRNYGVLTNTVRDAAAFRLYVFSVCHLEIGKNIKRVSSEEWPRLPADVLRIIGKMPMLLVGMTRIVHCLSTKALNTYFRSAICYGLESNRNDGRF